MRLLTLIIFLFDTCNVFSQTLPDFFDLRDVEGECYVTPVKEQNGGTCWAFAVMASMESNLLITNVWTASGEEGIPDLSEYHMDWWNGFNSFYNGDLYPSSGLGLEVHDGGNNKMAAAYINRGSGVVREIDASSYNEPPLQFSEDYHYLYSRDIIWFNVGKSLEKIEPLKRAIINHGAVVTNIAYDNDFIDDYYNFYQPPIDDEEPNHAITIIGWDDARITESTKRGAWICKNSWGASWGHNGYFWVSYYDKHACRHPEFGAVLYSNVVPKIADTIYSYDYHGWYDTIVSVTSVMNHFITKNKELLKSISFVTLQDSVDVSVSVYKSFEGNVLSDLAYSSNNYVEFSGYHTFDLDPVLHLGAEEDYYVAVWIDGQKYAYDRSHEVNTVMGKSAKGFVASSAELNQSFYKCEHGWEDFYYYDDPSGYQNSGNFCIKTFNVIDLFTTVNSGNKILPELICVNGRVEIKGDFSANNSSLNIFSLDGRLLFKNNLVVYNGAAIGAVSDLLKTHGVLIYK
ncbi:MAG: C1 family peptidase, partial [Bacteroidota bacterium]|nr:C1 family peptidase [Bacteroidota bacterium]